MTHAATAPVASAHDDTHGHPPDLHGARQQEDRDLGLHRLGVHALRVAHLDVSDLQGAQRRRAVSRTRPADPPACSTHAARRSSTSRSPRRRPSCCSCRRWRWCSRSRRWSTKDQPKRTTGERILGSSKLWLWMTALLGTTFLGFQAYEFTSFVHEGLTIRTNLFGSRFFTLTGFHGAHVTAGVLWLLTLLAIDYKRGLGPQGRDQRRHRRAVLALRRRRLDRDLHARLPHQVGRRQWHTTLARARTPTSTTRRWAIEHEHPTWSTYWKVALILTAHHGRRGLGLLHPDASSRRAVFVPSLLIMSAVKFAIVVLFYMHLRYDHKLFRALFTGPLIIAALTIVGLLFLFGKLSSGWEPAPDAPAGRAAAAPGARASHSPSSPCTGARCSAWRGSARCTTGAPATPPPARPADADHGPARRLLLRARADLPVAQRLAPRPERLLPVQRAHGAAPRAHPRRRRRC